MTHAAKPLNKMVKNCIWYSSKQVQVSFRDFFTQVGPFYHSHMWLRPLTREFLILWVNNYFSSISTNLF